MYIWYRYGEDEKKNLYNLMFDLMTTECFQGWTGINFWQTEYNSCIGAKKKFLLRVHV